MNVCLFLVPILVLLAAGPSWCGELYQWRDADGREHYADDISKVPEQYRPRSQKVMLQDDRMIADDSKVEKKRPQQKLPAAMQAVDRNGKGEEWWRHRAESLRSQLKDQVEQLTRLRKEAKEDQGGVTIRTRRCLSSYQRQKDQLDQRIAQLKYQLEVELPDEARKAGAYPRWIRE
jgi:hypothetical protein